MCPSSPDDTMERPGPSDASPTARATGPAAPDDRSPEASSDVSLGAAQRIDKPSLVDARRLCSWCGKPFGWPTRRDAIYCSKRCRQTAWRLRRGGSTPATGPGAGLGRFAYADPPYIGKAAKYYANQPDYAGEVDHGQLIASLGAGGYLGWALSCSSDSLRYLLPLCPPGVHVCSWGKPIGVPPATNGLHSTWEALLVVGGRQRPPGVRDWLRAQPARGGGTIPGRKPLAFCAWLFDCLGMQPGDELVDLFPGSGIVGQAWAELSRRTSTTCQRYLDDTSAGADGRNKILDALDNSL